MTIAIVLAGGSGTRMNIDMPKQFLCVNGKPVLVYTLESLQINAEIDSIAVVCIAGWVNVIESYQKQYNLTKLKWIFVGGNSCQESIRNGLQGLVPFCQSDDIVVIHDGVRPILEQEVLTDTIAVCRNHGNSVTALPYNEQIFIEDDKNSTVTYIPRERLRRVSTPQAYQFGTLLAAYKEAFSRGIGIENGTYANTLMVALGHRLFFSKGSDRNIKLTTQDDLALFQAYLQIKKRGTENEPL